MRRVTLAFTIVASLVMPHANALVPAHDLAMRAQLADLIVLAEPTSAETRYTICTDGACDDWALETEVFLTPLAVWKGEATADLSLVLPGGVRGELTVRVEDVPTLTLDQPVVLLLARTPIGFVPVGGELGAVAVRVAGHGDGLPVETVQRAIQRALAAVPQ